MIFGAKIGINIATKVLDNFNNKNNNTPPSSQPNIPPQNSNGLSGTQNLGRNRFNAATGSNARVDGNMFAGTLNKAADGVANLQNRAGNGFFRQILGKLHSILTNAANDFRKGDTPMEHVATNYYNEKMKTQGAHPGNFESFRRPTFDELNQDLRKMPTVRIGLMEANNWKDDDFRFMKMNIDNCLLGMQSPNLQVKAKAIADFNKSPYAEHGGRMPEAAADYALLSHTIGNHLAQKTAGPHAQPQASAQAGSEPPQFSKADLAFPDYAGPKLTFKTKPEAGAAIAELQKNGFNNDDFTMLKKDLQQTAGAQMTGDDFDKKYGNLFAFSIKEDVTAFKFLMLKMPKEQAARA